MRHCVVLFLLLFATTAEGPQIFATGNRYKWASQGQTQQSQREPFRAAMFLPEAPIDQTQQADPYNAREDTLYRWYLIATIAGVGGALGALRILWTQTQNLAEQIKVQRIALRQWVNTSDWKVILTDQIVRGEHRVAVSCAVSNVTRAPITLILISLEADDRPDIRADVAFPQNTLLLPDNPLRHSINVRLTDAQYTAYIDVGVVLRISGMIMYTDALEDTWRQSFRLTLAASRTSVMTGGYTHTIGRVQTATLVQLPPPLWRKAFDWWTAQVEAMKNGESKNE